MDGSHAHPIMKHYTGIYLDGFRQTTKKPSVKMVSLNQDLNLGHPQYKARTVLIQL